MGWDSAHREPGAKGEQVREGNGRHALHHVVQLRRNGPQDPLIGEFWKIFLDGIVQSELSVVHQRERCGGG
jgi:hypothetical protein